MTWTDIGELIKALGAIVTAGAAITGLIIAWRGIDKWRSETTGKRRSELAAMVLAEFYEFEEIIRAARNPFVMMHEMSPLEGVDEQVASDSSFAPERRLLEHQEFFGRFRSRKYEFAAVFGRSAAEPFDQMWATRRDINIAVNMMLQNRELRHSREHEARKVWMNRYNVAFAPADSKDDPVIPKLEAAVKTIEGICRPAIDARPGAIERRELA